MSYQFPFPLLQAVDIRQIYDKFPEKKGGLKDLYDKGPTPAFFLVKFWVSLRQLLLYIFNALSRLRINLLTLFKY